MAPVQETKKKVLTKSSNGPTLKPAPQSPHERIKNERHNTLVAVAPWVAGVAIGLLATWGVVEYYDVDVFSMYDEAMTAVGKVAHSLLPLKEGVGPIMEDIIEALD